MNPVEYNTPGPVVPNRRFTRVNEREGSPTPHRAAASVSRRLALLAAAAVLLGGLAAGCDTGPAPSLYDPDRTSDPDPVISGVSPDGFALAGVDAVTITGENFAAEPDDNLVFFGTARATILEASPTQLIVRAPNTPNPDLALRVSKLGAENFSNAVSYQLEPAAEEFGGIADFEEPFALTSDDAGNLYVSMNSDNRSIGVVKMAPDGTRSTFIESSFTWNSMDFGPDGLLYTVRAVRAVFRFEEGGSQEVWAAIPDNSVRLTAIAFDADGNAWVGGDNANLYRITPDATITGYPFEANVRRLLVNNGFLYAAATQIGVSKIWRFPITPGGLGAAEEYFDVTGNFGAEALALAFATNGDLFVGTDAADPIILVTPDRSGEVFYPGVLSPAALSFAWGNDPYLYMTQGRTDTTTPDLIRINTRREGAH